MPSTLWHLRDTIDVPHEPQRFTAWFRSGKNWWEKIRWNYWSEIQHVHLFQITILSGFNNSIDKVMSSNSWKLRNKLGHPEFVRKYRCFDKLKIYGASLVCTLDCKIHKLINWCFIHSSCQLPSDASLMHIEHWTSANQLIITVWLNRLDTSRNICLRLVGFASN